MNTTNTTTTKTYLVLRVKDQSRYIRLYGSAVDAIVDRRGHHHHGTAWEDWYNHPYIARFDAALDAQQCDAIMVLARECIDTRIDEHEKGLKRNQDAVARYDRALQALKDGSGPAQPVDRRHAWVNANQADDISTWASPSAWPTDLLAELRNKLEDTIEYHRAEIRVERRALDRLHNARHQGLEWMTVTTTTEVTTTMAPV